MYGCWNRAPLRDTIEVKTLVPAKPVFGQPPSFAIGFKEIPNVNSKDCRYDLRPTDPRCAGCRWIKNGEPIASTTQLKQETLK